MSRSDQEGPEPCRLLEQVMSHCVFCVSEGSVCISRYPLPQFVQTCFTDHSSRLSVSPTVCDQKTRVLVRSACRALKILSLYLMVTGLPLRSNSAKIELSAKLFDAR